MIVRPLRPSDLEQSSKLHRDILSTEFLARGGTRFLRQYHRAWIETADCLALAAVDDQDGIVGVLLGSTSPNRHYRAMLRHHGFGLAFLLLIQALRDPSFGRELVATRTFRYARGALRSLLSGLSDLLTWRRRDRERWEGSGHFGVNDRIGEITHVMVSEEMTGRGIGKALLEQARIAAEQAGLDELVLVTMPELPSQTFYEHLGWRRVGERISRSGEAFVEFRLPLRSPG